MKKIFRTFIKGTNWALADLMGLLGFACSEDDYPAPEYGSPYADFMVTGKVTNEQGVPLSDVRIVVPKVDQYQKPTAGFIPGQTFFTEAVDDTLYAAPNGSFEYTYHGFPINDTTNIHLKFEDLSANSQLSPDSVKVAFLPADIKGGEDGWYRGKAEKNINITLKRKEDETI